MKINNEDHRVEVQQLNKAQCLASRFIEFAKFRNFQSAWLVGWVCVALTGGVLLEVDLGDHNVAGG